MALLKRFLIWAFLFYLRVRVAVTLWRERRWAALSRSAAAQEIGISEAVLRDYELARVSPPLNIVAKMLRTYKSGEECILWFCCVSFRIPRCLM